MPEGDDRRVTIWPEILWPLLLDGLTDKICLEKGADFTIASSHDHQNACVRGEEHGRIT